MSSRARSEFVSALRPAGQAGGRAVRGSCRLRARPVRESRSALEAIAGYRANGGTALYDALADSLLRLKRRPGRRVVVVMTDGRDENNPGTARAACAGSTTW